MDHQRTRRLLPIPGGEVPLLIIALTFCFHSCCSLAAAANVSYDGRSLIIGGHRRLLFSGSIHYPRSTPEMWPLLISRAKKGGIDVIQTYVFWNVHEPQQQGQYNFQGRYDLVAFVKQVQAQGLYCTLRIGPFIQSEWNYGGFPFWLRDVPGIVFRSDNQPFKYHMQRFTSKIVDMMKAEKLYASQGGPIILSQIENEYENVEAAYRDKGASYVRWAASMALQLQTGVPWIMCKQRDAPGPVINTCNGRNCGETFLGPNSPTKPSMWTENWTSFYQVYGKETPMRSAQDIAFEAALFIAAKKGSLVNYYMYHGGTNFGRYASAFVTANYYDQAPLDEYGLIQQPKWGHLRELHAVIKQNSGTLLLGSYSSLPLGQQQEGHVFQRATGQCVAFIVNKDGGNSVTVKFRNTKYALPGRSISILPDCRNVVFNTAKVSAQYGLRTTNLAQAFNKPQAWQAFPEGSSNLGKVSFVANALLDQLNSTKDKSDYLWYSTNFEHMPSKEQLFLHVYSQAHVVHAFINGMYLGYWHGNHDAPGTVFDKAITLKNGENTISLLSVMVGSPDSGAYLEQRVAGIRKVKIQSNDKKTQDISYFRWEYQVGLEGENLRVHTSEGSSKVAWGSVGNYAHKSLIWYKTTFNAPPGDKPVALNLGSMGKGEAWINGESIGRYWVSFTTARGQPSQSLYHVPSSFLRPTGNLLVLFEEIGGDPLGVSLETVSITGICGYVSEKHLPSFFSEHKRPSVELQCPGKTTISAIKFASYGTPVADCERESYATGRCHSAASRAVAEKACLGRSSCSLLVSSAQFGGDPCPRTVKSLAVSARCR